MSFAAKLRTCLVLVAAALFAGSFGFGAYSQTGSTPAPAFSGAPVNRSTLNASVVIATGNTFQTVLASNFGTSTQRQQLTVNNNNATDSCWLFLGSGTATKGTSILLLAGASYRRDWPFVPSDAVQATCVTSNDTLYVDTQ